MSIVVPPQDLAPSVASRIVSMKFASSLEGTIEGGPYTVSFALIGDLRVPADDVILQAGVWTVELDEAGYGQIRLPTHDPDAIADGIGNDWFLIESKSWTKQTRMIRIPQGTAPISLADINEVVEVTPAMGQWLVTGAGVEIIEGSSWGATVAVAGGIATFKFTVPPGSAPALQAQIAIRVVSIDTDGVPYYDMSDGTHFILDGPAEVPFIRTTIAASLTVDASGVPEIA